MTAEEQLTEAFRQLVTGAKKVVMMPGLVKEVDEVKMSCSVEFIPTGIVNEDIRLRASVNDEESETPEGFYLIPDKDSNVQVVFLDDTEGCVAVTDKVAKILYLEGDLKLEMDALGIRSLVTDNSSLLQDKDGTSVKSVDSEMKVLASLISLVSGDKIEIKNGSVNLKEIIGGLIALVAKIVVIQGVGPDVAGLADLNTKLEQLMS